MRFLTKNDRFTLRKDSECNTSWLTNDSCCFIRCEAINRNNIEIVLFVIQYSCHWNQTIRINSKWYIRCGNFVATDAMILISTIIISSFDLNEIFFFFCLVSHWESITYTTGDIVTGLALMQFKKIMIMSKDRCILINIIDINDQRRSKQKIWMIYFSFDVLIIWLNNQTISLEISESKLCRQKKKQKICFSTTLDHVPFWISTIFIWCTIISTYKQTINLFYFAIKCILIGF